MLSLGATACCWRTACGCAQWMLVPDSGICITIGRFDELRDFLVEPSVASVQVSNRWPGSPLITSPRAQNHRNSSQLLTAWCPVYQRAFEAGRWTTCCSPKPSCSPTTSTAIMFLQFHALFCVEFPSNKCDGRCDRRGMRMVNGHKHRACLKQEPYWGLGDLDGQLELLRWVCAAAATLLSCIISLCHATTFCMIQCGDKWCHCNVTRFGGVAGVSRSALITLWAEETHALEHAKLGRNLTAKETRQLRRKLNGLGDDGQERGGRYGPPMLGVWFGSF